MTKQELLSELALCFNIAGDFGYGDPESAHSHADAALLEFINDPEIRAAFERIHRWYA